MEPQQFRLDYSDEMARQIGVAATEPPLSVGGEVRRSTGGGANIAVPSILKTGAAFVLAGVAFFGAEIVLPGNFKPSTLVGTYDARVTAAVKAAELEQQIKLDEYNAKLKLTNDQNLERYRAQSQAILGYYSASYERAKIYAGGIVQLQQQYTAVRLQQTQQSQASDMGLANIAKFLGRIGNIAEPGLGDPALSYADGLTAELTRELDHAAQSGITIEMAGWDTNLPSPVEVQAALKALEPAPLPFIPRIGETAPRQDFSSKEGGPNGER